MEPESNNTAVKIIAIIGGVVVVVVLTCGIVVYFGFKMVKETVGKTMETLEAMSQDVMQSQAVADSFLTEIQTDNLDGAYESTTEAFKKRMPRKDFDDLVKKHPALKEPATNMGMDSNTPMAPPTSPQALPNNYRYKFHAQSKDGKDSIDITIAVNKEGGAMKVDKLTIKKAEAGDDDSDPP